MEALSQIQTKKSYDFSNVYFKLSKITCLGYLQMRKQMHHFIGVDFIRQKRHQQVIQSIAKKAKSYDRKKLTPSSNT